MGAVDGSTELFALMTEAVVLAVSAASAAASVATQLVLVLVFVVVLVVGGPRVSHFAKALLAS